MPNDFVWGAATSSYQIEGAGDEDGRGESIWDTFCRYPGRIVNGDTGERGCDHYHRLDQDLDLMAELGLHAYRFSVAWPRVLPHGIGAVNVAGLDFYDRLVDGLLQRGITPFVTLYHWDLPQPLQDQGGWEHRDTVHAYVAYAAVRAHDGYANRWFLDPLYGRGYPADMVEHFGSAMPTVSDDDLGVIATPTDFLGVNSYNPAIVKPPADPANPLGHDPLSPDEMIAAGYSLTAMGWPIVPEAFGQLITRIARDYQVPAIYITENGAAFDDVMEHGTVDDPRRVDYFRTHLAALKTAIDQGAPVRGYFAWSLLDNFEWAWGYAKRFGIVHVDFDTMQRTPKASALWLRDAIAANQFTV